MSRRMSAMARRIPWATGALTLALLSSCWSGAFAAGAHRPGPHRPPRATVLEVQHLFQDLGYPLGNRPLGGFGVRTKGALSYFQHKYGLPVTGYPNARTIAKMQAVVASLRGSAGVREPPPHDLVERVFGNHLPILGIAIALAVVLALLALSTRKRPSQESATAETTIPVASEDT